MSKPACGKHGFILQEKVISHPSPTNAVIITITSKERLFPCVSKNAAIDTFSQALKLQQYLYFIPQHMHMLPHFITLSITYLKKKNNNFKLHLG